MYKLFDLVSHFTTDIICWSLSEILLLLRLYKLHLAIRYHTSLEGFDGCSMELSYCLVVMTPIFLFIYYVLYELAVSLSNQSILCKIFFFCHCIGMVEHFAIQVLIDLEAIVIWFIHLSCVYLYTLFKKEHFIKQLTLNDKILTWWNLQHLQHINVFFILS